MPSTACKTHDYFFKFAVINHLRIAKIQTEFLDCLTSLQRTISAPINKYSVFRRVQFSFKASIKVDI
ncbi:MAG: hypothetical protein DWQ05_14445 [Calditrichaeota bacterium]|nr:MAG: hypothetical protein DWQ05_14445 [Calditrichota bacterium]